MSRGQQMLMASLNRQHKVQQKNNFRCTDAEIRCTAPAKVHLPKPPEPRSCSITFIEVRGEEQVSTASMISTEPQVSLPETTVPGSERQPGEPPTGSMISEAQIQPEEPPCGSSIPEALTSAAQFKRKRPRKSYEKNENAKEKHPLQRKMQEKMLEQNIRAKKARNSSELLGN